MRKLLEEAVDVNLLLSVHEGMVGAAWIRQFAVAGVERGVFKTGAEGAAVVPAAAELGADVAGDDGEPVDEGTTLIPFRELLKNADEDLLHGIFMHFGGQLPADGAAQHERAMRMDDPGGGALAAMLLPRAQGGFCVSE